MLALSAKMCKGDRLCSCPMNMWKESTGTKYQKLKNSSRKGSFPSSFEKKRESKCVRYSVIYYFIY